MKKLFTISALALLLIDSNAASAETTITFDDIADPGYGSVISNGYAGFNWSNFDVLNTTKYNIPNTGYQSGLVSGSNVAYNDYSQDAFLYSPTAFSFQSAYMTSAWNNNNLVTVTGYLAGTQTQQASFNLNTFSPTFAVLNWSNVDKVAFRSSSAQFVMDNFTVSAAVSEADTYVMLLAGLGLIGFSARRKQK